MGVIEIILAAAVILLALAGAEQARSLRRLSREIGLQRKAVDELLQRQSNGGAMEALTDRIERERERSGAEAGTPV